MSTTKRVPGNKQRKGRTPVKRSKAASSSAPPRRRVKSVAPLASDPRYAEAVDHMQMGRWQEAQGALADLRNQHPDSAELERLQQALALRLSAEETWSQTMDRPAGAVLRLPVVQGLLLANVAVYLLLGALWLFGRANHLLR